MASYKIVNIEQLEADLTAIANKIREKADLSEKLPFPSGFISGADQCSSLNVTVVGGTTQPSSPKENTIWVNTSTAITSWVFSATQPDNPTAGLIWFSTGTSSSVDFNALKKNGIQVYPLSAKQYVSGAFTPVPASIYQGSKWNQFSASEVYLFNNGDKCTSVTGGWTTAHDANESVTIGNSKITFEYGSGGGRSAAAYTVNKIDVSNYSTIAVTGKIIASDASEEERGFMFGLTTSKTSSDPSWTSSKTLDAQGNFSQTLDISKVSGSYYVGLYAHGSDVEVYTVSLR